MDRKLCGVPFFFFFFFFYLQAVGLGSRFPEHDGEGGGVGPGCQAAAEGLMWRAGWRGDGAEGTERSELVWETMQEFVWMGVWEGVEG